MEKRCVDSNYKGTTNHLWEQHIYAGNNELMQGTILTNGTRKKRDKEGCADSNSRGQQITCGSNILMQGTMI